MPELRLICSEVEMIMEVSPRAAQHNLRKARAFFEKNKHQCISLEEFCDYKDLNLEVVRKLLQTTLWIKKRE